MHRRCSGRAGLLREGPQVAKDESRHEYVTTTRRAAQVEHDLPESLGSIELHRMDLVDEGYRHELTTLACRRDQTLFNASGVVSSAARKCAEDYRQG